MTAFEMVSVTLGVLGLLGGTVGFVRAVLADRRSSAAEAVAADAQADAASALAKSADATERIAKALELIASRRGAGADTLLAEQPSAVLDAVQALLGVREVRWAVEARTVPNSYRLRNVGSLTASEVTTNGHPEHATLTPGAAITFRSSADRPAGGVEVTWRDDSAATTLHAVVAIPEP